MLYAREKALFENRYDAGQQLAERLLQYKGQPVVVLAIPNGGAPVGMQIALALEAELDVVISRKLPLPLNPEAGFGAVADDGNPIFNEQAVADAGLTSHQINYQVNQVRVVIRQRSLLYRKDRPLTVLTGKTAIIVDDGLASGFTMLAAVESVRRRKPEKIVAAVPVASLAALERVKLVVDEVITVAIGTQSRFAVADFYQYWHDLSDQEAVQCFKEWQLRRFRAKLEPPPG